MKVRRVEANNRRKAFAVTRANKSLACPFAQLEIHPTVDDPIDDVYVDRELGAGRRGPDRAGYVRSSMK